VPIVVPKTIVAIATALVGCCMFLAAIPSTASAAEPELPSWIRAGDALVYIGYSGNTGKGTSNSVVVSETTTVTAVERNAVYATTVLQTIGTPLTNTYRWACTAAGICSKDFDGQFWVDPKDPIASIRGPDGEIYKRIGSEKYTDLWKRVWPATVLAYSNAQNGVSFTVIFDSRSGLILTIGYTYPTEVISIHYYN
jgi:hypothetical protein